MTTPLRLVTDEDSIPSLQDIEQVEDTAEYVRMVRMRMDFLREDILNSLSYLSPETQARIRHNADQARVAAQAAFLE